MAKERLKPRYDSSKSEYIVYINEMGPIYSLEYKNMIEKERKVNNRVSPMIDK